MAKKRDYQVVPSWDANAEFVLSGAEMEKVMHFLELFTGASAAYDAIQKAFGKAMMSGVINQKGFYTDTNEPVDAATQAEIDKNHQTFLETIKKQQEASKIIVP